MTYDYYYSKKCEDDMKASRAIMNKKYFNTFINGIKYTEMIEQGKEPMTAHYPDIKKIYTGKHENVVIC